MYIVNCSIVKYSFVKSYNEQTFYGTLTVNLDNSSVSKLFNKTCHSEMNQQQTI